MLKNTREEVCPCCRQALPVSADLMLDEEAGAIVRNGRVSFLPPHEMALFMDLYSKSPRLRSKEQLLAALYWNRHDGEEPEIKIIDVFVCKLRKQLKPLGIEIQTAWGRGYRLLPILGETVR